MVERPRILVAEDDPELLGTLVEALEYWGAEVMAAETGADFVLMMQEEGPFDLVITDVSLPWVDGLLVVRAARRAGSMCPVIVMTAHTDERIPAEIATIDGQVVLLKKPFGLDELEGLATALLATGLEPEPIGP